MKAVLDTSVLIGDDAPDDVEAAISVASITELHFGVLVAENADERARGADRLAVVEATFEPLPVTVEVARAWGRLAAAVAGRGGKPRRRQTDLAIAATATVEQVPLLTHNVADFHLIDDLIDVPGPERRIRLGTRRRPAPGPAIGRIGGPRGRRVHWPRPSPPLR